MVLEKCERREVLDAVAPWQNAVNAYDVNADGNVTPQDALIVANELNAGGEHALPPTYSTAADGTHRYVDVNADLTLSQSDYNTLAAAVPSGPSVLSTSGGGGGASSGGGGSSSGGGGSSSGGGGGSSSGGGSCTYTPYVHAYDAIPG